MRFSWLFIVDEGQDSEMRISAYSNEERDYWRSVLEEFPDVRELPVTDFTASTPLHAKVTLHKSIIMRHVPLMKEIMSRSKKSIGVSFRPGFASGKKSTNAVLCGTPYYVAPLTRCQVDKIGPSQTVMGIVDQFEDGFLAIFFDFYGTVPYAVAVDKQ